MEYDFGYELVSPVPRREEILRDDSGERNGASAEGVVGEGVAAGAPGVEVVAMEEDFVVEGLGEVVDEDLAGAALVEGAGGVVYGGGDGVGVGVGVGGGGDGREGRGN